MEHVTYGMHNQHIVDIKEIGERVLPFAIKREEPVLLYHQHQDQYRAPDTDYSRAQSRSRSPTLKGVDAFHIYCVAHGLNTFAGLNIPRSGPNKRQVPLSTTVSDLPVDVPKKRLSRNRCSTPTSDSNIITRTRPRRSTKLITIRTTGTTPEDE